MTAAQQHSLWHLVLNRSHWKRTQVSHAALSPKQIQIHKLQLYEVIRNETTKYALYEVIHTLVPISNVSTAWKAPDPFGNLQLPPAASTSSDMPPQRREVHQVQRLRSLFPVHIMIVSQVCIRSLFPKLFIEGYQ
jgi:hypothetical protein